MAAGFADVFGAAELAVTLDTDESSSVLLPDPMAWNPTSKKMTPRNSSTITMARKGSPVESGTRSFIDVTVSRSAGKPTPAPSEQAKSQVSSKPSRRAARAFCRLARSRRSRFTSIGSAANASGRSTNALSTR